MPSLPPEAKLVLERLQREDEEHIAAARLFANRKQAIRHEKTFALAHRAALREADERDELFTEKHGRDEKGRPTLERERDNKRLREADEQIAAIQRKEDALGGATPSPRFTAARAEHLLEQYAGADLAYVERPALPLSKNERAVDALPRFRAASLALIAERKEVETAPLTLAEAERAAHAEIDRIADRGLPKSMRMFHGSGIDWPTHEIPGVFHRVPDGLALVAFLLRDPLKTQISKLLKINSAAFPHAMSVDEKKERLTKLAAEIDKAERIEAACVERIIDEGGAAYHRPALSILAVLSLRVAD